MLYAILDTMHVGTLQQLFPQTSFPSSGPTNDWLKENGCLIVSTPTFDASTEKLVECDPYLDSSGVLYNCTVEKLTAQEFYDSHSADWTGFRQVLAGNSQINQMCISANEESPLLAQIIISFILGTDSSQADQFFDVMPVLIDRNLISSEELLLIRSVAVNHYIPQIVIDRLDAILTLLTERIL